MGLSQGRRRRRDGVNSDLDLNRFRLEVYLHVVDTTARKRINEVLNGKRATVTYFRFHLSSAPLSLPEPRSTLDPSCTQLLVHHGFNARE